MFTKRLNTRFVFTFFILVSLFFSSLGTTPAYAAGITVNTNVDELTTNGLCSLREAIINANNNAATYPDCAVGFGIDTITFAGNYTITLAGQELPVITSEIIISGKGAGNTIIQASTCNPVTLPGGCTPAAYRVFAVSGTGNLTLNSTTVRHGWCNDPCEIGGGIVNGGTLTVTNSTLSGNRAYVWGGGIYNTGTLTVTNSTLSGNSVEGSGGGIYNYSNGALTITNSTIQGNTAGMVNSGGGLYIFSGTLTVTNSTLSGNSAGWGGGIFNYDGNLTVTNSTLSGNSAGSNGGGIYNSSIGALGIVRSTLFDNSAGSGGALYNVGNMWLANSTLSGNEAYDYGGGIYSDGSAWIYNSTIAFNTLIYGTDLGAGGIDGDVALYNSLVAGNTRALTSTYRDCSGTMYIEGMNLFWDLTNCSFNPASPGYYGTLYSLSELGPLQDNGGPTWTHALIPIEEGSRAIDAGDDDICAFFVYNLDQRGVTRPQGSHCDVGAYEYEFFKNWAGGVSITSNRNIVAVGRPHISAEVMTYNGFSSGSLNAYVPMLFKDAFGGSYDSALYIQNVDAANTANITIKFYNNNGNLTCSQVDTIAALSSKGYWLPSIACLGSAWVGGVKVESNRNIVAVGRPHIGTEVLTYNGFSTGSLNAYVPMLFKDAFGGSYDSALYIQNVDAANSASITIKFYNSDGVLTYSMNDTLSPLAAKGYWLPSVPQLGSSWTGGVKVESNRNIVAVGRPHIGSQILAYDGFSAGSTSSYTPMLFKNAFGGSYDSALYLQNVDPSNTASVTIKFYDSNGNLTCSQNDTIAPLASKGYWLPNVSCLGSSWVGGVKVESNYSIVAVGRPHLDSQVMTYDGFSAGSLNAFVPMLFKDAFGGSYDSALYLQNVDPSNTANVTIKFYDSYGNLSCTISDTLAALASKGYWLPSLTCAP